MADRARPLEEAPLPIRLVKVPTGTARSNARNNRRATYPIFTRKPATDVSYVACAAMLLSAPEAIYPAFATHNCRTVATILELAGHREFEFQKLLGMGDALYDSLLAESGDGNRVTCRIYAPVGSYNELLPYLVAPPREWRQHFSRAPDRRPDVPLEALIADPIARCPSPTHRPAHPAAAQPFPDRLNSLGLDLSGNPFSRPSEKILSR